MSLSPALLLASFARVLSSARAAQCMALDQLSRDSGIALEILEQMEAGRHAPTLAELVGVAKVLGCEADELIERTMAGIEHH